MAQKSAARPIYASSSSYEVHPRRGERRTGGKSSPCKYPHLWLFSFSDSSNFSNSASVTITTRPTSLGRLQLSTIYRSYLSYFCKSLHCLRSSQLLGSRSAPSPPPSHPATPPRHEHVPDVKLADSLLSARTQGYKRLLAADLSRFLHTLLALASSLPQLAH